MGYRKENGQVVCRWGLNFNFKRGCYQDPKRCKDFKPDAKEKVITVYDKQANGKTEIVTAVIKDNGAIIILNREMVDVCPIVEMVVSEAIPEGAAMLVSGKNGVLIKNIGEKKP
jgi:hypothetical protein